MNRDLRVPHISKILFGCKYLCKVYCVFKNNSRYSINLKKKKMQKVPILRYACMTI